MLGPIPSVAAATLLAWMSRVCQIIGATIASYTISGKRADHAQFSLNLSFLPALLLSNYRLPWRDSCVRFVCTLNFTTAHVLVHLKRHDDDHLLGEVKT